MGIFSTLFRPNVSKLAAERNVSGLIAALAHEEPSVRRDSAKALGDLGETSAVPLLVTALKDPNSEVHHAAAASLLALGAAALDGLSTGLRSGEKEIRRAVPAILGSLGGSRSIELLAGALGDADAEVRRATVMALARIGEPTVDILAHALATGSAFVRDCAADAMVRIGAPSVEALLRSAGGSNDKERQIAIISLGKIGDHRAIGPLLTTLKDVDASIQRHAVEALDRIGWRTPADEDGARYWAAKEEFAKCAALGTVAIPLLEARLGRTEEVVRRRVVEALAEINDPKILGPMAKALEDESWEIRRMVAAGLAKLGDPHSIQILIRALQDGHPQVQKTALKTIERLGPPGIESMVDALAEPESRQLAAEALDRVHWKPRMDETGARYQIGKRNWRQCIRIGSAAVEPLLSALIENRPEEITPAIAALGAIGDRRALAPIAGCLDHEHWEVRRAAAEALGVMASPSSVDCLVKAAEDPREEVGDTACRSLGMIRDSRAVEALAKIVYGSHPHLRQTAAILLGKMGDSRAVEPLVSTLSSGASSQVLEVLAALGDQRALPPLVALLSDESWEIRRSAAEALGVLACPTSVDGLTKALKDAREEVVDTACRSLGIIGDVRAVEPLAATLRERPAHRWSAANALDALKWKPTADPTGAWYYITRKQWDKCREIGRPAISPLLSAIGQGGEDAVNTLVSIIQPIIAALPSSATGNLVRITEMFTDGNPSLRSTLEHILARVGWTPSNDEEGARYWIRKWEWARCSAIGLPAVAPLIEAFLEDVDEAGTTLMKMFEGAGQDSPLQQAVLTGFIDVLRGESPDGQRRRAGEQLIRMFKSGHLGAPAQDRILALRPVLTEHTDSHEDQLTGLSSDCTHEDTVHVDHGLALDFPI